MCAPCGSSRIAVRGPGVARRRGLALVVALLSGLDRSAAAGGPEPPRPPSLVQVARTVAQDQGAWVVDYRLRQAGPAVVVVAPERVAVRVESWVSNSRVAAHAVPRRSVLSIPRGPGLTAVADVIPAENEAKRCREKLTCQVSVVRCPSSADAACTGPRPIKVSTTDHGPRTADRNLILEPGGEVRVRLRLEHQHAIFGEYDPLLGVRSVEITLAGATVRDVVPLDRERYLAQPRYDWPEPPVERRDSRHALTGPDSLHLEAHVPGHHYYRFPDRPVRYSTPMRLRFWYLIAAGTEGPCRVAVAQYKETPTSWRPLSAAGFEKDLTVVGRWTRVEHVFTTDAEATTLALDFRIASDADIGEMWIDDVSLEPVGCPGRRGP